jgi:nitrogen fixation NifU-like protein
MMGKQNFNFWKDHSVNYLKMAFQYDRREQVWNPDGYGKNTGECGDTVEMFLRIRRERIQSVSFNTNGCINTNACCNTAAHLAEGKSVEAAWGITPQNVINYLKTLPPENYHCAELAVGALYLALSDYQQNRRDPWKKLYKKK